MVGSCANPSPSRASDEGSGTSVIVNIPDRADAEFLFAHSAGGTGFASFSGFQILNNTDSQPISGRPEHQVETVSVPQTERDERTTTRRRA